jgi:hypothetical protein
MTPYIEKGVVYGRISAGFSGKYRGPLKPQPAATNTASVSIATMRALWWLSVLLITARSVKREDKDYERY